MEIRTEKDITGPVSKAMRDQLKMSQLKFWGAVCVPLSTGCAYETGKTAEIPKPVRRLLYLQYVAGVPTDATASELKTLGKAIQTSRQAARAMRKVVSHIDDAVLALGSAKDAANALP